MTLPEPELSPPPRPLLGVRFWALIALGVLGPLAGVGIVYLAPRLAPAKPEPPAVQSAAPVRPMVGTPTPTATPSTPTADVVAATAEVARLSARINELEGQGVRASHAAAAALAAAAVVEAAQSSRPFAGELAMLRAANPDLGELASLDRLAETGAPSRVALAMSFPEFAARALRRARKPAEDARLSERIAYGAARFVTVRQLDAVSGPDADISAAERALQDGDVAAALKRLARLPPPAQEALAPWREGAQRRAEIDHAVAGLRARAQREATPQGPAT